MKKLLILTLLSIFAFSATFAQISKDQAVAEWTRAKSYTKAYLDAMPADGYTFKPTPEMRSFSEQMLHLADADYFFVATVAGKESPMGKTSLEKTVPQNKEAVTKAVMESYDWVIATLKAMTEAQLKETRSVGKDIKAQSGLLLAKGFEHQTHHRGQTTVYLRLKGSTPPPEMLF